MIKKFNIQYEFVLDATSIFIYYIIFYFITKVLFVLSFLRCFLAALVHAFGTKSFFKISFYTEADQTWLSE